MTEGETDRDADGDAGPDQQDKEDEQAAEHHRRQLRLEIPQQGADPCDHQHRESEIPPGGILN